MKIKFIFFILFLLSSISFALENKTIIAASNPWPPFVDPENSTEGLSMEIIRAAFKTQGYIVQLEYVPWLRAELGAKNGTYDILSNVWYTEERSKYLNYSDNYAVNEVKFISLKENSFEYSGVNDLNGKKIGVVRGYAYINELKKIKNVELEEVNEFVQNIKKMILGRVDLTLEDEIVARVFIAKEDPNLLEKIKFSKKPFSSNKLYVASGYKNPRNKEIIEAFNKGLKIIKENGTYDKIMKKYGY